VPSQRPKGNKIGLYRVRSTKIAMPASSQIWSDKEEETVMVPLVFGAEWFCSTPNQREAAQQNFSSDIVPADFAPVGAASANGRAHLDYSANYLANQPVGHGEDAQAQTKAQQMVPAQAGQKLASAAPIGPPQMDEFAIYVEVPSLGTMRQLNSGAFHGKLNDLYERGLIARESARAAMRLADDRRRQLR